MSLLGSQERRGKRAKEEKEAQVYWSRHLCPQAGYSPEATSERQAMMVEDLGWAAQEDHFEARCPHCEERLAILMAWEGSQVWDWRRFVGYNSRMPGFRQETEGLKKRSIPWPFPPNRWWAWPSIAPDAKWRPIAHDQDRTRQTLNAGSTERRPGAKCRLYMEKLLNFLKRKYFLKIQLSFTITPRKHLVNKSFTHDGLKSGKEKGSLRSWPGVGGAVGPMLLESGPLGRQSTSANP